jgi:hypothetical protein
MNFLFGMLTYLGTDLLIRSDEHKVHTVGGEEFCLQRISVITAYFCQVLLATNRDVFANKSRSSEGRGSPCVRAGFL